MLVAKQKEKKKAKAKKRWVKLHTDQREALKFPHNGMVMVETLSETLVRLPIPVSTSLVHGPVNNK